MSEAIDVIARSQQAAHDACAAAWRLTKDLTAAGKPVHITAAEAEDDLYLERLKFYWGIVLRAISEQVGTPDKWAPEAWHNLLKRKFLGYEIKKEQVAGSKRVRIVRRLRSLRDLKKKARAMATYLQEVQAYAVTELGVVFPEQAP